MRWRTAFLFAHEYQKKAFWGIDISRNLIYNGVTGKPTHPASRGKRRGTDSMAIQVTGRTAKTSSTIHMINVTRRIDGDTRKFGERCGDYYGLPLCGAGRTKTSRRTGAMPTSTEMRVYFAGQYEVTCERCKALMAAGAAGAQRERAQDFAD